MTGSARRNRLVPRLIVGALAVGAFGLTAPLAAADGIDGMNPKFETSPNQSSNPLHRPSLIATPGRTFAEVNTPRSTLRAVEKEAPAPNVVEAEKAAPAPRANPAEAEQAPTPPERPAERTSDASE
ncbi:hypothetical protein H7J93_23675 [Mycobacterium barrassiae]|uniref:hypothetical protein n=1 Tax=Mycobacterium barrassiae TaxID=319709 RepID=UPI002265EBEF|nr:hypothetical protein [Mycobacterium barrassiae]MCV7302628.1 hypothetical protein [Mycobacterium barrassiae]